MSNANMITAKSKKNDEFYTQYCTIEKELVYYKDYLKDKIVYCNCDTQESNFVKFLNNVKALGVSEKFGILQYKRGILLILIILLSY